jgi:2,4-dienoyl-CoA reductase-like NADH-dependent reductase (Old Yellow Enzyme family)
MYRRIASFRDAAALRAHCAGLGIELPCDDAPLSAPSSPLAAPLALDDRLLANRFVIQPMEGWDGTTGGEPSQLTRRRWRNFGRSGAAWIWGGEAVAVRADGRANPHQLVLADATAAAIGSLRRDLLDAWREIGAGSPPWIGLQLTHSGRWARPGASGAQPRIAFRHPLLDRRVGIADDTPVLSDIEVEALIAAFARAARLAQEEGFEFVDLKHCHGYLLHEFLAARRRGGVYGGAALAQRLRLLHALIGAVRTAAPRLALAVRLSVFDALPHRPAADGHGVPEDAALPYEWGFGLDPSSPQRIDLAEPIALVRALAGLGIRLLNVTAGSPYYVPHLQRPALFPPSDGYQPPEDPLAGVARLLGAARDIKAAVPEMTVVSTGWSYLQEFIPHVAQACLRDGWFDAVGLGRMVLAYPELPADVLAGRGLDRRRLCRTFSDCTTAPRNGLVSGCYPLDPFYRAMPERERLERVKQLARSSER